MSYLSRREAKKLDLEIQNLQKKNKWELRGQFMPPIIATLLGIVGLSVTVCQFQSQRRSEQGRTILEQQKDRLTREVDQRTTFHHRIRADIDEILLFTQDQRITVSRLAFLLEDVKTVLESDVNETQPGSDVTDTKKVSALYDKYERKITNSLVILIKDDCEFARNPRDVRFANTVIRHWDDYSAYFREAPEQLEWILFQYTFALRSFRDANRGYVEGITVDEGFVPSLQYKGKENAPALYSRFIDILDGFKDHIEILDEEKIKEGAAKLRAAQLRKESLAEFEATLCNRAVAKEILDTDFTGQSCKR